MENLPGAQYIIVVWAFVGYVMLAILAWYIAGSTAHLLFGNSRFSRIVAAIGAVLTIYATALPLMQLLEWLT